MLAQILLLIACCVIAVAIVRRMNLPPILGYLFVGIALGPHALGWIDDSHAMHLLGEIGIAFLLFSIGLEFSLPQFLRMRHVLLVLGGAQVAIGTFSGALIAWWLGIPPAAAVVVGGALAMSSTAIVVKQLTEQVELQARHGNLALGILLFQDLAAVPFLVAIPVLSGSGEASLTTALAVSLIKAIAAVAVMLALGRYALRPLFHEAAAARSTELFTLTALMVSLFAAWTTALLGLSLALGAFLAGMMLSETEYRHQLDVEMRPFKDVLMGLFFITVGMSLNLGLLPEIWWGTLLLAAGLVLGKGGAIVALAWLWDRDRKVALRTGVVLAHGGEFGFALLALALGTGLLNSADAQPILAAIIVSMLVAPLMVRHNEAISRRLLPPRPEPPSAGADEIAAAIPDLTDHVVICGYGRVGGQIAALLRTEGIDFVAADLHPHRIREAWDAGEKVFYGDATRCDILDALGIARARTVVVSFDDESGALSILNCVRRSDISVPVLVRSRDDSRLERLLAAGAREVVPETLETSLTLASRVMGNAGVEQARIDARVNAVREERYLSIRDR